MAGHWCICGVEDAEHDIRCWYEDHTHMNPLCCPECPCLSYEQAHPELFGALLAGRVAARTKTRMASMGILTMERLDALYYAVYNVKGVGPVTRRDMWSALYQWRKEIEAGTVVRKPLPEDMEFGTFEWPRDDSWRAPVLA
jgi:hypothetical protein